jgi:hypothetical protein
MDWIIQDLFELPSPLDGHEAAQEKASNPALNWLRQVCLAAEADARLEERLTASEIVKTCRMHSLDIPGLATDAADEKAQMRVGCIMANAFTKRDAVECDGFQIQRTEATQYSEERHREVPLKTYVIRRFAPHSASQHPEPELL